MRFEDKTLTCKDCKGPFLWTAGEQAFFAERGLVNIPARCPDCRKARKEARGETVRAVHVTTCAKCNKTTTVPFVPRNGTPVYCASCLKQERAESEAAPGASTGE